MANLKINDLAAAAAVTASMQFETDTGGTTSEKVTALQIKNYIGVRESLTSDRTYYINSGTGNDTTGNGTSALPWATINKALSVASTLDGKGNNVILNIRGVFSENVVINQKFVGITALILEGDTTAPANATISPAAGAAISLETLSTKLEFKGLKLGNNGCSQSVRVAQGLCEMTGICEVGTVSNAHFIADSPFSEIRLFSSYTVSGDCQIHWAGYDDGFITGNNQTPVTITASVSVNASHGWLVADRRAGLLLVNITWTGTFTGPQYSVGPLSMITSVNVNGAPGNIAGSVNPLGSYN